MISIISNDNRYYIINITNQNFSTCFQFLLKSSQRYISIYMKYISHLICESKPRYFVALSSSTHHNITSTRICAWDFFKDGATTTSSTKLAGFRTISSIFATTRLRAIYGATIPACLLTGSARCHMFLVYNKYR
jgi:hypothetical protein